MYYYVCTVHAIYSIVIYSSTNFGYTEYSRSSVRYTCFVQYSQSLECFVSHSVQCVVSSFVNLLKAVANSRHAINNRILA